MCNTRVPEWEAAGKGLCYLEGSSILPHHLGLNLSYQPFTANPRWSTIEKCYSTARPFIPWALVLIYRSGNKICSTATAGLTAQLRAIFDDWHLWLPVRRRRGSAQHPEYILIPSQNKTKVRLTFCGRIAQAWGGFYLYNCLVKLHFRINNKCNQIVCGPVGRLHRDSFSRSQCTRPPEE